MAVIYESEPYNFTYTNSGTTIIPDSVISLLQQMNDRMAEMGIEIIRLRDEIEVLEYKIIEEVKNNHGTW